MHIRLMRHGQRALIVPIRKDLIDCPLVVRLWLGTPYTESVTDLTIDAPLPGIHVPTVLAEILQKGFCALDVYGVVRFSATSQDASHTASASAVLRDEEMSPARQRG